MSWQQSPAVLLFVSLAVILHYGSQIRAKAFPEITDSSQPTGAATVQDTAKLVLQPTNQVLHRTIAARSTGGHLTSPIAATTSNSETPTTHTTTQTLTTTSPVTTNNTPSTSPIIHTLITTLATPNTSHTTTPVTEATIGPSAARRSPPPTITPPAHTTGTSPATVSHTTGKTTQPSKLTTLLPTLSTSPCNSTTSQKPTQPTHASGTTTVIHNATQTASPATTTPGPTLAPQPSTAKTGIYQVLNGSRLCIKAEMGIQLTVQDTESVFSPQRYFNIDPNTTQASGNCGSRESNLLLNFQGGFVNLTFTKDENSYYMNEVGAYLTVSNPEKIYQGMKSTAMMFETVIGHSFKCVSEQSIQLSAHLQLKTMNVQLQAFDFEDDHFGNVDECSSDYTVVLPVIGAIVLGLCAVGLIVYGIRLRRESSGYQRI
ncbi:lysosomal associated membrane protein 3 [Rhinolophus ferrumequinum]|uniref:Lysosome-associated membrane glycoprotein 3 n=1 Tax=Rhinolophus ferrumequinum TaxID=59479 RepID=A0A7J8AER1_RHIFE|nr:lysosome-associated membrane glycoprotein 3 isoform X2 [Rhinolophus ferrumequinum]KAF6384914.1 lysosomal associated membrane protein 3 [Rhinolophus ferrumequinum]